ncbi:CCR4-NOT transcription complex subunit 3-like [Harpia harpyja]|uniref:CCR4-NOT transcription complex subunit 3-like n=1 Tax=Harpia harpyja TaxID=202280 RepID=UPI0022B1F62A|nr:CCR4-NOT transcription complex subunit 3-like [Harpia harpyja]
MRREAERRQAAARPAPLPAPAAAQAQFRGVPATGRERGGRRREGAAQAHEGQLKRRAGAEHAQKAGRQVYVAGVCRRSEHQPFPPSKGSMRGGEGDEFRNRRRRSALLGDRSPARWGKKKKNHLRVTSGKDAFVHGETHTARAAPETGARRGRYSPSPPPAAPPPAAPLGASFHGSPARAAATAVIPSILNLTSSHTRDEVIEGNARHVRSAPIGRRGSGGRGAAAAGRVAVGDGYGGSPTRRPSPTGGKVQRGLRRSSVSSGTHVAASQASPPLPGINREAHGRALVDFGSDPL